MGAAEKISISLSPEDLRWARERAKQSLSSVSAVLAEALRRQRQAEARASLLADLGTDDITEGDRKAVRAEWQASNPKPRPPRTKKR
jgi:hypothetical protein